MRDTIRVDGRPSFGAWMSIGDAVSAELLGRAGYDWLIADLQHGALTFDRLASAIQAAELGRTPVLVRTPWNHPDQLMRALDLGAHGVVVPMVSTPEQARAAAQAVRCPPLGVRSYGPVRSAYSDGPETPAEPACLLMIETVEALENLEAIAGTPGVDGLFVGPIDLAYSLGFGLTFEAPQALLEACERVVEVCRRHGLVPGCAATGPRNTEQMIERGMQFLTIGGDAGHIRRGGAADMDQVRRWLEGRSAPGAA